MGTLYEFKVTDLAITHFKDSFTRTGVIANGKTYSIGTNGSFYLFDGGMRAAGPCYVDGKTEQGVVRAYTRGMLGVVGNSGMVRMLKNDRAKPLAQDAEQAFGAKPTAFMGGGFMLIDAGRKLSLADIQSGQSYDAAGGKQLETSNHIFVGNKGTDAYIIAGLTVSATQTVGALKGYDYLCMFDGGKAFWIKSAAINKQGNSQGRIDPIYWAIGANGSLAGTYEV